MKLPQEPPLKKPAGQPGDEPVFTRKRIDQNRAHAGAVPAPDIGHQLIADNH